MGSTTGGVTVVIEDSVGSGSSVESWSGYLVVVGMSGRGGVGSGPVLRPEK